MATDSNTPMSDTGDFFAFYHVPGALHFLIRVLNRGKAASQSWSGRKSPEEEKSNN
jgi:hypothetical protein